MASSKSEKGAAQVCWWADFDDDSAFDVLFSEQDGGSCDAEPQNQLETETDYTDAVAATWVPALPATSKLDCTPELVRAAVGAPAAYLCSLYEDSNTNGIKDDAEALSRVSRSTARTLPVTTTPTTTGPAVPSTAPITRTPGSRTPRARRR